MSRDPRDDEAYRLIDAFAAQLLDLNDGKAIPTAWKIRLKKVLQPHRRAQGLKKNLKNVRQIVKLLALDGLKIRAERTKHNNPAAIMDAIAAEVGVSRKTVYRLEKNRPEYMGELERMDALKSDERKAYMDGLSDAIGETLKAEWEAEREQERLALRRRFPRLFSDSK